MVVVVGIAAAAVVAGVGGRRAKETRRKMGQ